MRRSHRRAGAWPAVALLLALCSGAAAAQRGSAAPSAGEEARIRDRVRLAVAALEERTPPEVEEQIPPEVREASLTTIYLLGVLEEANRREIESALLDFNVLASVARCTTTCVRQQVRRLAKDVLNALKTKLEWWEDPDATITLTFPASTGSAEHIMRARVEWLSLPATNYEISSPDCGLDWAVARDLAVHESGFVGRTKKEHLRVPQGAKLRLKTAAGCESPQVQLKRFASPLQTLDSSRDTSPVPVELGNEIEISYRLVFLTETADFQFNLEVADDAVYEIGTRNLRNGADTALWLWSQSADGELVLLTRDDDGRRSIENLSSRALLQSPPERRSYHIRVRQIAGQLTRPDGASPQADVYFRRLDWDEWREFGTTPVAVDLAASPDATPLIDLRTNRAGTQRQEGGSAEVNKDYRTGLAEGAFGIIDVACDQGQWLEFRVYGSPVRLRMEGLGRRWLDFGRFRAICNTEDVKGARIRVTLTNLAGERRIGILASSRPKRQEDVVPVTPEPRNPLELNTPYRVIYDLEAVEANRGQGFPPAAGGAPMQPPVSPENRSEASDDQQKKVFELPCTDKATLRIALSEVSTGFALASAVLSGDDEEPALLRSQDVASEVLWLRCDGAKPHSLTLEPQERASGAADLLVQDFTPDLGHNWRAAPEITSSDEPKRGTLLSPIREQWARFTCDRDEQTYAVETFGLEDIDTRLELRAGLSSPGTLIDEDDDSGETELASRLTWKCDKRRYWIRVTGYDESEDWTGTFKLRLEEVE